MDTFDYTYSGNENPSENTTRLILRGGALILELGQWAALTLFEYRALTPRYILTPGRSQVEADLNRAQFNLQDLADVHITNIADGQTIVWDEETAQFISGAPVDPVTAGDLQDEVDAREQHEALTTSAHGGIVASTDSRLTNARAPTSHTHPQSDVTGLSAALAAKQDASAAATDTELQNAINAVTAAIALKQDASSAATDSELTTAASTLQANIDVVSAAVSAITSLAPAQLDTLKEAFDRFVVDENAATALAGVVSGKLAAASNLSDLASAATARTNLGLGTAATQASGAFDSAGAAAAAQAASQPLDSDLTAIAALATTAFGRGLLALVDAAAGRTALGLGSASTQASGAFDPAGAAAAAQAASQPLDSDLTAIAALSSTAFGRAVLELADAAALRTAASLGSAATHAHGDYDAAGAADAAQAASQPLDSDLTAIAALATTTFGRSLLALADAAATRTALGLDTAATQPSTAFDVAGAAAAAQAASQPLDSDLTAIAALSTTSFGRALLALADAAAGRTALGLGTAATHAHGDYDAAGAADAEQTRALAAEALLAPLASPALTGSPTVPNQTAGDASTKAANTAFVTTAVANLINGAPGALDTLKEIADQLATDESGVAALTTTVAAKAAKSANLSDLANAATARTNLGLDTAATHPATDFATAAQGTDSRTPTAHAASHASAGSDPVTLAESQVTGLVADLAAKAPLASPTFTGTPAAPTAAQSTNTTQVATTAYVQTEVGLLVPKSLVDAKGDLLVGTADNTVARKAVGADFTVLRADSSQSDGLVWAAAANGWRGDGSDGALTFDGTTTPIAGATLSGSTYTLTRDVHSTSLTVNAGVTVKTAHFLLLATGTFTVASTAVVHNDGTSAVSSSGASNSATSASFLIGSSGGAGSTTAGAQPSANATGVGSTGGAGGAGTGGAGGAGGAITTSLPVHRLRSPTVAIIGMVVYNTATRILAGGAGGGGGGGDVTNPGGGGGAGGGVLAICAAAIVNNGTIRAAGGAGRTQGTGNVGGGGGGGVLTYSLSAPTGSAMTAPGGTKGNGVGTGTNGADGSAGTVLNVVVV